MVLFEKEKKLGASSGFLNLFLVVSVAVVVVVLGAVMFAKSKTGQSRSLPLPSEVRQPGLTLSLESPNNQEIITNNQVKVKGRTLLGAGVLIYTENDTDSVESDGQGKFEGRIRLAMGLNKLTVTAFAENGEEKSLFLDVVSDDRVIGEENSKNPPGQGKKEEKEEPSLDQPSNDQEPTKTEASPGRERKEEPPKAIVGNVEKVNADSVVVEDKSLKEKVETKVTNETVIINQDTKNTIKLDKVKPNTEAAVIVVKEEKSRGEETKKEIKEAARIFVQQTTSPAESKRHGIQGVIVNIEGNVITLRHQIQTKRNFQLLTNSQTVVKIRGIPQASLADLAIGQRINAVGDLNTSGLLVAKLIHVIPGKTASLPPPPSAPEEPISPPVSPSDGSPSSTSCSDEVLTVPFTAGAKGKLTTNSYQGCVEVQVSGTGQASGTQLSDAFYVFTDSQSNPLASPIHYNLPYNWTLWINGQSAELATQNQTVPSYTAGHLYNFTVCLPTRNNINFGVGDTYTVDNSGSYEVQLTCPK